MTKEEMTQEQAMQYLKVLVARDNSQVAKDMFECLSELLIDTKNAHKLLDEYCKACEEYKSITDKLKKVNENQSQMLKALKPYLGIKELDRKDGKGKEYRCYVKNGYRDNYFNISKEEYELFKGWLKND